METIELYFLWLKQSQGINLSIGYDAWDRAQFFGGVWLTVR